MSIIRYSVKNPIIVNIVMVAILILGGISLVELPRELNPKIAFNWIFIVVPYPGVGADEIEKLVTIPLEEAIQDVDDIKTISSESNEGGAFVWVQFEDISDAEFKDRLREVESEVNGVDLPDDALDPIVDDFETDDMIPIISVSIVGDIPERQLSDLADDLKEDLVNLDGVSQVALTGTREREIWVEVDQEKLYQHQLALSQVVAAVRARNLNLPAGNMDIDREAFLVRTVGEVENPDELKKVVVRWNPRGNHLYLGAIATVTDRFKRETSRARFDGHPAATLSITKKGSASSLKVIEEVKRVCRSYSDRLPAGAKIAFTNDNSLWIRDILNKLQTNALFGLVLVLGVLYLFLGIRNAVVAAVGIPVSFMATFFFMARTGQTFNGNALFGLILVLGVVVDDAIIVVENCFRHRQMGKSGKEAAVDGTHEVLWPVMSATLTTIAAFLPLVLMTGIMGKFMRIVPIVVSLTLAASLLEVFFIAPSHFAELAGGVRRQVQSRWFIKLRRYYTKALLWVLRRRFLVGPVLLLVVIIMAAMIPLVGVELFRGDEWSQIFVWVRMPAGTTLEETDRVIRRVEAEARSLPAGEVHAVIANAGILQEETDWVYSDHVGQVIVDLVEKEFRERSMDEIMADIRRRISFIEGPSSVKVAEIHGGPPVGKPVEVKVKGKYLDELAEVAGEVKGILRGIPGVSDVGDDNTLGKREIRLVVDESRAALHGLTAAAIAREVRTAVDGELAGVFHDADEEVDIRVKVAGLDRSDVATLKRLAIPSPISGAMVRLDEVCRFEEAPTLFQIRRFEQERAITVSAEVDRRITTPIKVNAELARRFAAVAPRHPGYRLDFRGEMQEFKEAFNELGKLFMVGILLIFTILGAQFKSVRQSFIILLTIPFGFIGSMLGLLLIQKPFSILTLYGMVALAGIAVNDAIVMVSFINNARARGAGKWRSIIQAGRLRLRPIILTSVTTIIGLMPMAFGLGGKSESWSPLAHTIAWGLLAATLLTLLVIPSVYSIVVDEWFGIPRLWVRVKRRR